MLKSKTRGLGFCSPDALAVALQNMDGIAGRPVLPTLGAGDIVIMDKAVERRAIPA
jgi:hypothetical protein